jgi:hypothetical protein
MKTKGFDCMGIHVQVGALRDREIWLLITKGLGRVAVANKGHPLYVEIFEQKRHNFVEGAFRPDENKVVILYMCLSLRVSQIFWGINLLVPYSPLLFVS